MTIEQLPIDERRVRRLFARPRVVGAQDFVQREVSRRMAERLSAIRLDASRVLDAGCGSGIDLAMLRARFAEATICGVDFAHPRLARAAAVTARPGWRRWLGGDAKAQLVEADFAALPFAAKTFDCVWSNLALHWSAAPHRVLPEWHRVTRVGGLVAFSAFGPDTLQEVSSAFAGLDHRRHVMPFTDMHDYGDMLVASGFTAPVVDTERLTLTYADAAGLWRDVRALGGDASIDRARGLAGRGFADRLDAALARGRTADGRYALTFELVYAHAWKPEPRTTAAGEAIVRVQRTR